MDKLEIKSLTEKYFKILHPNFDDLDKKSHEYETAIAERRYIEDDIERIQMFVDFKQADNNPDLIKKIVSISQSRFFADIYLDEYSNFVQKEDFSGKEKENYDLKQEEINYSINLLKKHMDTALISYYKELDKDESITPLQALTNVVEQLKVTILPSNVLKNALSNTSITLDKVTEAITVENSQENTKEGEIIND